MDHASPAAALPAPASRRRLHLLDGADEYLNLAWPIVLLAALTLFYPTLDGFSKSQTNVLFFLTGVLLLNVVHNVFTLFIVFLLPGPRAWMETAKHRLWAQWAAVFVGFFFFFFVFQRWLTKAGHPAAALLVLLLLRFYANFYHTIRQVQGISTAYTRILEKDSGEPSREDFRAC